MKRINMKHLFSVVVIGLGISVAVAAEPYDFFRNVQYPRTRRQDVGLDRVKQAGGPDAVGYNKRVVDWWPKRGIDVFDIPEGVPLRTVSNYYCFAEMCSNSNSPVTGLSRHYKAL